MHKFYDFACRELKELENRIDKGLSSADLDYANKLLEMKKNILKTDMLESEGYSADEMRSPRRSMYGEYDYSGYGRSRYSRRGRSRSSDDIVERLEDIKDTAMDENVRYELNQLIRKMRDM